MECELSVAEKTFIVHGIQGDMREDGRSCDDFRHVEVITNVISNANGSARVKLANMDILVGVKAEVTVPSPEYPDRGSIVFFTDCSANASPKFEGKGGDDLAVDISATLSKMYDNDRTLNLESLCIDSGNHCWCLHVDIVVLEFGGNVLDAISIAVKAALYNTSIPIVKVVEDAGHTELEISDDPHDVSRLHVASAPIVVTLSKVSHKHIVDATVREEACAIARLILAVTEEGIVTHTKTHGKGSLQPESISEMLQTGRKVGRDLNEKLMNILKMEEKKERNENQKTMKYTTFLVS